MTLELRYVPSSSDLAALPARPPALRQPVHFALAHPAGVEIRLARHPVPGIAHRILDLVPRGLRSAALVVAIPAGPQVGLHIGPGPAHMMAARFEAVLVGRA